MENNLTMKEKVAIVKCPDYKKEKVKKAIGKIFEICEVSLSAFPDKILLKPNMLSARKPEDGVTTHPVILESFGELFKKLEIFIGDSPANTGKQIQEYWENCGYKEVSKKINGKLIKFDNPIFLEINISSNIFNIPVTEEIMKVKILNLPKLKTHNLTILTSAIKNLYGLIPGFHKSILHSKFISSKEFSLFLVEFYEKVKERIFFNIVDGIVIMEGDGPASGNLKNLGYLIGGKNTIAVEMACAKILGLPYSKIPVLELYNEKFGLPEIEINGDFYIPLSDFKLPSSFTFSSFGKIKLLVPFLKIVAKFFIMKPFINESFCHKCYNCIRVCPVKAISKNLEIDRKKCIRCLCCFEVCPYKAIKIKKSFLARLFT